MGFLYVPGDPGAQMVGFHKVLCDAVFVHMGFLYVPGDPGAPNGWFS